MHPPFSVVGGGGGGGGWTSNQILKKGGLTGPQLLERDCWERGGWLFSGGVGCNFHIKNELKSEIFKDKKVYKQKYFPLSTKNSNWDILSKNLVAFKR